MQAEVSTLFGLNIYTEKGVYIGKVNDVVLEVNEKKATGLAATKLNPNMFDAEAKVLSSLSGGLRQSAMLFL